MEFDPSKRKFFYQSGAVMLVSAFPFAVTKANPAIFLAATGIIGTVVSAAVAGVCKILEIREQNALSLQFAKEQLFAQRFDAIFATLPVNEQLIMLRTGGYMNGLMSKNIDGSGTKLYVDNGRIGLDRGGVSGLITSDMADMIGNSTNFPGDERVPVPTRQIVAAESERASKASMEFLSEKGYSDKDYSPFFITPASLAIAPRKGGEDFAFISMLNKKSIRQVGGKSYAEIKTTTIPHETIKKYS